MSEQPWRITLLGPLSLRRGDKVLDHFRTRYTAEVLAYLASFPEIGARRDGLVEMLWPNSILDAGRNNLRIALNSLRVMLEESRADEADQARKILHADRTRVQLNQYAITTDKGQFEALLRKASRIQDDAGRAQVLQNAVGLYQQEFLPDFDSQWVVSERCRLADAYLLATRRLIEALCKLHEYSAAFDVAHRAIQVDPLREESHQTLLQLYASTGQAAEATRHYESMQQQLYAELGTRPTATMRALIAELEPPSKPFAPEATKNDVFNTSGFPFPSFTPLPRAPRPSSLPKGKLPLPPDTFRGREEELSIVQEMIRTPHTRLITLTGLGGSGKTRLALALGKKLQDEFEGAIWYVPLESLQDSSLILETTAQTLGLPRTHPFPIVEQLAQAIGDAPALLILDNFEHLLPDGARAIRSLLDIVPELVCLVTSRQRLNIMGEYEYAVQPLPTPGAPGTPERLLEFASVQLFADRARQVRPDFTVEYRNCDDIGALCHYLEGIPLAIELAAAYVQTLTPAQIRSYIKPRFPLLVNRRRDTSARHASLQTALDWSFQQLSPDLQAFLAGCSLLRGTWSLRAAETVCEPLLKSAGEYPLPRPLRTVEALTQLRERSLLITEDIDQETHYKLLETVREFAAEQLSPADGSVARVQLCLYALELAEEAEQHYGSADAQSWMDKLEREHDNIRAALHLLLDEKTPLVTPLPNHALKLSAALNYFWYVHGYYREGKIWLARALENAQETEPELWMRAQLGRGNIALALQELSEAGEAYETVHKIAAAEGNNKIIAIALSSLASVAKARGDLERARTLHEQSLEFFRELNDASGIAICQANLANTLMDSGHADEAEKGLQEALAVFRLQQDSPNIALCLNNLADLALQRVQILEACELLHESLRLALNLQCHSSLALTYLNVSALAAQRKRERAAAELLGYVEQQLERLNTPLNASERAFIDRLRSQLSEVLGANAFSQAWEWGKTLPDGQVVRLAETELALAAR